MTNTTKSKKHKAKFQGCHDSCDGELRPRPLQLQGLLCAKVPRGGALPPETLRSPTTRAQGQVPNVPKPRLGALLRSLVTPALLACCESLGIGVSGCCMMQTDDAGRLRLQRWRSCWTPARARRYHHEGAVPARPGPGKFALKKNTVSDAAFFLREPPKDLVELHNVNGT
jgi:hypothetical protein